MRTEYLQSLNRRFSIYISSQKAGLDDHCRWPAFTHFILQKLIKTNINRTQCCHPTGQTLFVFPKPSAPSIRRFIHWIVLPTSVEKSAPRQKKHIRELKQQRQRRLRKRHSKSEVALIETLSRLFHLVYFVKCWYQSLGKEKESCCLVFPSSTKHEFKHYVVVEQRR